VWQNNLFSAKTIRFAEKVHHGRFPTLVYPTRAMRTIALRFLRSVVFCLSISSSFSFSRRYGNGGYGGRSRSPVPGPLSPMPPLCFSRCVHIRVRRGSRYSHCASSTLCSWKWAVPGALCKDVEDQVVSVEDPALEFSFDIA